MMEGVTMISGMRITKKEVEEMAREAVSSGDHTPFALFFLSLETPQERFSKLLNHYIEAYQALGREMHMKLPSYSTFRILQDGFWCTEDFAYTLEHLEKPYIYNTSTMSLWRKGESFPSRAALFQLAFYLRLTVRQLNCLLMAAGEPMLYVLDPMDACVMAYLRKFRHEQSIGRNVDRVFSQLLLVKESLNALLHRTSQDTIAYRRFTQTAIKGLEDLLDPMEMEAIKSLPGIWQMKEGATVFQGARIRSMDKWESAKEEYGICQMSSTGKGALYEIRLPGHPDNRTRLNHFLVWDALSGKLNRFLYKGEQVLAYTEDLGWSINGEIELLRKKLLKTLEGMGGRREPSNRENREEIGNTYILTNYYLSVFEESDEPEDFLTFGVSEKEKLEIPFARKRYGFLRKTSAFLNGDKFRKNLRWPEINLCDDGSFSDELLEHKGNFIGVVSKRYDELLRSGKVQTLPEEKLRERRLDVLNDIWQIDAQEESPDFELSQGKFTSVRFLNQGRKIAHRKDMRKDATESEGKEQGVLFDMGSRQRLMKYAVATGNEDEVGKYLVLSGYWERDWTYGGSDEVFDAELLGRSDFLLLYTLACRDALIEIWSHKTKKNPAIFRDIAREQFPMIWLLLQIEDEILWNAEGSLKNNKDESEVKKALSDLRKDFIYHSGKS